ncbi:MAG: glycosyltransferase family 4 protein [Chloroherpetonaceae bacterium]|nr:glycosyltransferase family 4 protein [Chthonomonadaceae bacterium]MDW8206553.1 glycosyltransferase family 4 protein [Chloroherpetonaceae bacterium]
MMLSWEYPPRIVGGIARHVEEISWALARMPGVEVHVVTCAFPGAPMEEVYQGVHIHRVTPYEAPGGYNDFVHWVHQLNAAMRDRAWTLCQEWLTELLSDRACKDPKQLPAQSGIVLHVHDWLAYFAGVQLKHAFKLPLVATIHATEFGRNNGIHSDISRYIHSIEKDLVTEAWRVIVCSGFMKGEIEYALQAPQDKIDIIYNGIHTEKFEFDFPLEEARAFRCQYAAPYEKMILFVGRGVREKGAHILIEAFPKVRQGYHDVKLVMAGGGYRKHLEDRAHALGIWQNVYFTGFVPDDVLLRLYKVADVACFPSLYEPFGIVALEAMASHTPVVVSDAGGLPEVVEADVTGTVTWLNNPDSLAWGLLRVLHNPQFAREMAERAYQKCKTVFNWDRIAEQTHDVYTRVWSEYQVSAW